MGSRMEQGRWGGAGRAAFLVRLLGLYVPVTMQRQAPAVPLRWRAPVPVHRQSGGLSSCAPATCTHSANCAADRRDAPCAVLGQGLTCPLLCNAKCAVLGCQGCRHPCRDAKAILMVWTVQKTMEIFSCSSLTRCRCLCCAGPASSSGAVCEKNSRDPTVAAR